MFNWLKRKPTPPPPPEPAKPAVPEMSAAQLKERLTGENPPLVVDVREAYELAEGKILSSIHIPMGSIPARLSELPTDRDLVLQCAVGQRSYAVGEYLLRQGYTRVYNLTGGIYAWKRLHQTGTLTMPIR